MAHKFTHIETFSFSGIDLIFCLENCLIAIGAAANMKKPEPVRSKFDGIVKKLPMEHIVRIRMDEKGSEHASTARERSRSKVFLLSLGVFLSSNALTADIWANGQKLAAL